MTKRITCGCAAAYLLSSAAGASVAISRDEPANFAGWDMHGASVTGDFLIGAGTAMSAPAVLLVVFAAVVAYAITGAKHARYALWVVAAFGVGFAIGQLGEPLTTDVLAGPTTDGVAFSIVVANIVLPIVVALSAWSELRRPADGAEVERAR